MAYMSNRDYFLEIARGNVSGMSAVNKFGRAPAGVQTTSTDIWSRADAVPTQQIWVAPTAARIHEIVSSSASDASAGVGARTVRVQGLTSWSAAEVSEDVTLNGTTPVNTVNSYVIIHRMKVLTSGATNINVGTISATAATDATVTAIISASQGQTQMAIYGVPSIKTAYLKSFYVYMNDASASTRIDTQLRLNENPNVQLLNFINKFDVQLYNSGLSGVKYTYDLPVKLSGPCIIKVQAVSNVADTDVSSGFDLILIDN